MLLSLFTLLISPPILLGIYDTEQSKDMLLAHLPQVDWFVRHPWSLLHYRATSATTPGQHIVLAWFARCLGYTEVLRGNLPVRFANAALGYLVLVCAWRIFRLRTGSAWRAAILTLPLACSSYVLFAAIWIATDNGAFLFYELAVAVAAAGVTVPFIAILIGAALVFWRQMYLPVSGIFGLSWLLQDRRIRRLPVPVLACVAPLCIIAAYFFAWHGLTPPGFQTFNGFGFHTGTPLAVLGLIALFSPFYIGYLREPLQLALRQKFLLFAILGTAVCLWLMGPSSHDVEQGRWGGMIWTLARHGPIVLGSRSPVVLALALLGGLVLSSWIAEAHARREIPFDLLALGLYVLGYSLQVEAFERYVEAPVLFTYGFACARTGRSHRFAWIGPVALALLMGFASLMRVYGILPRLLD